MISIPIRLGGKNSPNLRNKRVAPLSDPTVAPQFFCWLARQHNCGLEMQRVWGGHCEGAGRDKDKGNFYSNPSYFSSGWHLTVIFAIYINVCDIPVRAGDTRAWLKQKEARVQIQAEQKNFNIVVTAECEVEQSWCWWSTIGLTGPVLRILTDDSPTCLVSTSQWSHRSWRLKTKKEIL